MPSKKRTSLSGITPEQLIRLEQLALDVIGIRSVSALIRHIADYGHINADEGYIVGDWLVVHRKTKGKPDGD